MHIHYTSLLKNIVSFIGLFCKRDHVHNTTCTYAYVFMHLYGYFCPPPQKKTHTHCTRSLSFSHVLSLSLTFSLVLSRSLSFSLFCSLSFSFVLFLSLSLSLLSLSRSFSLFLSPLLSLLLSLLHPLFFPLLLSHPCYGVATVSRIDKIIGLFYRISSIL